jgi:hypothetical protein
VVVVLVGTAVLVVVVELVVLAVCAQVTPMGVTRTTSAARVTMPLLRMAASALRGQARC